MVSITCLLVRPLFEQSLRLDTPTSYAQFRVVFLFPKTQCIGSHSVHVFDIIMVVTLDIILHVKDNNRFMSRITSITVCVVLKYFLCSGINICPRICNLRYLIQISSCDVLHLYHRAIKGVKKSDIMDVILDILALVKSDDH